MLRKGVYPYKYMNDWEKHNETSLSKKENVYSHLDVEEVTAVDYKHVKRVCKDFQIKNLEEYHYLYVQNDTLLLTYVSEKFRNLKYVFRNIPT